MLSTLLIVLPVFALILTGWVVRRTGVMGPHAAGELNRFVVYLALPALLFDIIARAQLSEIWQPGLISAFGLSCVLVFAVTLAIRWRGPRHLADAAIDALGSSYANTGYMGFPLALAAFGSSAMTPTLIASIITVCVIFAAAIVLVEVGLQTERRTSQLIWKVGVSLAKNPLLVAPLLGAFFPLTGTSLPDTGASFLKLLGGAASPCALVSLGLFLAEKRESTTSDLGAVNLLMGMKLVLHPLAAWMLGKHVFHLPPSLLHPAVLLAALPTGTGPFMLAEYYRREASVTAKAIIGSTLLSILTITVYLRFGT
ncbi:hypothetical protein DES53_11348 [Roseimicrobium gellanilyticum]|uniref:Transporter n=1 Tax=Roseimicrobium gellanilyticum TaxID=748857 RepID=A0A366H7X7_9BACT|nr:AEC family transporter [Roseimicrobium gellanilyticum]RBP37666.1 hypothetical protein DES53_11348 [Roseimicrobium gellanilyticum]